MAMLDQRTVPARLGVWLRSDRFKVAVDATQEIDQRLSFLAAQAREKAALALERRDYHRVVFGSAFWRERNRMCAAIELARLYLYQIAFLHTRKRSADRTLVKSDDTANARSGDSGLNRKKRHDAPFCDIHVELLLIQQRGTAGQFVGDKRHESGDVTLKVEGSPGFRTFDASRRRCLVGLTHKPPRQIDVRTIKLCPAVA